MKFNERAAMITLTHKFVFPASHLYSTTPLYFDLIPHIHAHALRDPVMDSRVVCACPFEGVSPGLCGRRLSIRSQRVHVFYLSRLHVLESAHIEAHGGRKQRAGTERHRDPAIPLALYPHVTTLNMTVLSSRLAYEHSWTPGLQHPSFLAVQLGNPLSRGSRLAIPVDTLARMSLGSSYHTDEMCQWVSPPHMS